DEPWRVLRTRWRMTGLFPGPIEGGGRPSGYFSGATGIMIYRGNAFPEEFRENAFVADCGSNLIHRKRLFADGVGLIARRPDDDQKTGRDAGTSERLASRHGRAPALRATGEIRGAVARTAREAFQVTTRPNARLVRARRSGRIDAGPAFEYAERRERCGARARRA